MNAYASPSHNVWRWITLATAATLLSACTSTSIRSMADRQAVSVDWNWGPTLPVVKSAFCTAAVGGDIVTVGGTWWGQDEQGKPIKRWRSEVYRLSFGENKWRRLPDFPRPVGYALAVAIDAKLYVIGGTKGPGEKDTLRGVYMIDLAADEPAWRHISDLPRPASRLRGGRVGQSIVVIGTNCVDGDNTYVWTLDTENIGAGWWQTSGPPHDRVGYLSGTTCGDSLYVFGGGTNVPDGIRLRADAYALNLSTSKWRKIEPLPIPMRDMTVSALDHRFILIVGGVEQAGVTGPGTDPLGQDILSSRVYCYDTLEDVYRPMDPLRLAVADFGLAVMSNRVVVVAGEDSVYKSRTGIVQVGVVQHPGTQTP